MESTPKLLSENKNIKKVIENFKKYIERLIEEKPELQIIQLDLYLIEYSFPIHPPIDIETSIFDLYNIELWQTYVISLNERGYRISTSINKSKNNSKNFIIKFSLIKYK